MVEGNSTNTRIPSFTFLVAESPSNKAKLLLPIMPVDIVAFRGTTFVETAVHLGGLFRHSSPKDVVEL